MIDGFLYGSRDNGIYRLKVESPAVHEEITNNYRGAESNFFSFSNEDLFVENNPVWSFDTNNEIWTKRPELSHNTYAFSGDSLLIILKKKGATPIHFSMIISFGPILQCSHLRGYLSQPYIKRETI
ncbi:MAG: hypothetical protein IPK46_15580 [Saprospiraceae bacterium]|nr:hypothetical protein [Saprospiraceae bacterium]